MQGVPVMLNSGDFTLLFWDDNYLSRWNNCRRGIGQPQLVPEATLEEPGFWLGSGYPTAFKHESGVWRILYNGKSVVPEEQPDSYALGSRERRRHPLGETRPHRPCSTYRTAATPTRC